ncbi:MAG: hypothetical protein ACQKBV_02605 [Puniceicoccales bacterium]
MLYNLMILRVFLLIRGFSSLLPSGMQPRFFSFLTCLLFIFSLSSGVTYAQKDPVEVVQVKFDNKAGAYDDTLMNVEIGAMGNPTPDESPNEKYVDNITVTLTIGYAHPSKQGEFIFHKSSVEIATMEVGESRQIGFWLPYDIAVRDNLREEPQFWYVDLEVDGQEVKPTSSNMRKRASGDLQNPQALQSFQSRSGDASEGILLPGYLSGNGYLERGNERPPFIRKEEK